MRRRDRDRTAQLSVKARGLQALKVGWFLSTDGLQKNWNMLLRMNISGFFRAVVSETAVFETLSKRLSKDGVFNVADVIRAYAKAASG